MSNRPRRRRSRRAPSPPPQQWLDALRDAVGDGTDLPDGLRAQDVLDVATALAGLTDADGQIALDDEGDTR